LDSYRDLEDPKIGCSLPEIYPRSQALKMSREHSRLTGNKTRGECIATLFLEVKILGMLQAYVLLSNVYAAAAAGERGFQ
jgi:hypothetical protein